MPRKGVPSCSRFCVPSTLWWCGLWWTEGGQRFVSKPRTKLGKDLPPPLFSIIIHSSWVLVLFSNFKWNFSQENLNSHKCVLQIVNFIDMFGWTITYFLLKSAWKLSNPVFIKCSSWEFPYLWQTMLFMSLLTLWPVTKGHHQSHFPFLRFQLGLHPIALGKKVTLEQPL